MTERSRTPGDTEALIRALGASGGRVPALARPGPRLALGLAGGAFVSLLVFLAVLGPRPELGSALFEPRVIFKLVVALALGAAAAVAARLLAQPEGYGRLRPLALGVGLLVVAGVAAELAVVPASDWAARAVGTNAVACLVSIPLLALAPLAALLAALKGAAPARPRVAGLAAGLAAGAVGALLYASHCQDDSPLFVALWYGLAVAATGAAGAAAGTRLLRW